VLEFATVNGSICTMLADRIGTLTPGKDADIVLLSADRLNVWPINNVPGAVVSLMNPQNVDTVFIAGKVKKWRGGLVGVDVARVLRIAAEARDGVIRRANFHTNLFS
jgi:cytosine/adenosine deaminase-related metal-dependent hydrolase